jgi:putative endopeptidase
MDSRSKYKTSRKRQKRSPSPQIHCAIPTQARALSYSSPLKAQDFYKWVNQKWLRKTPMPTFENDYGISEEVERCIYEKSLHILMDIKNGTSKDPDHVFLRTLTESCLHSGSQHTSVEYLQRVIHTLECIQDSNDVVRELAKLSSIGYASLFSFQYIVEDSKITLCLNGNVSALPTPFYSDKEKIKHYKELLQKLAGDFHMDNLERVFPMEHSFALKLDEVWSEENHKTTGRQLANKFPGIPWDIWFEAHNLQNWKSMPIVYRSPRWIRFVSQMLKEVSIDFWKLYIARAYIVTSLRFLPPPYDEMDFAFFGKLSQGQIDKTPQKELLVNIVHDYCGDLFSKVYWEKEGDKEVEESVNGFVESIFQATYRRIEKTEWLSPKTRERAIQKVRSIRREVVRPSSWAPFTPIELDSNNLLFNIFRLGEMLMGSLFRRVGQTLRYWDEGIYRVNAYYYSENNEIMIPYGTTLSPFYSPKFSDAWNFGALGSIIGHEICHAFDEDGRLRNEKGEREKWWTRKDNLQYNNRSKKLIALFNKQTIEEKHVDGKKTLSENIADLGGLAIALDALQHTLQDKDEDEKKEIYREFFIAFTVSWRTKYRPKKLQRAIEMDTHAPAFLRVNLVVSQFEEWIEAFDIQSDDPMYREPKERIRIF